MRRPKPRWGRDETSNVEGVVVEEEEEEEVKGSEERGIDAASRAKSLGVMLFLLLVLFVLSSGFTARGFHSDTLPGTVRVLSSKKLAGDSSIDVAVGVNIGRRQNEAVEFFSVNKGGGRDVENSKLRIDKLKRSGMGGREQGDDIESIEAINQRGDILEDVINQFEGDQAQTVEEGDFSPKVPFSRDRVPGLPGVSLDFGRLSNSFKHEHRDTIKTRLDLPRVFPGDVGLKRRTRKKPPKRPVCVFTRTPRQNALFKTNIISMFGSGTYDYVIMRSEKCQHEGTCASPEQGRRHPKCNPDEMPTVHLLERIRNFGHERFEQVLKTGMSTYDVLVATGDEFCRANGTHKRAHFRTYAGPNVVDSSFETPVYLPLGPREEFERVFPSEVRLASERRYKFNFLGSLTSPSRMALAKLIRKDLKDERKFLHIIVKWNKKLTRMNGYVPPTLYRKVLLSSVFTLCPMGHNPESFRIFEACEAGSIPILVLDSGYYKHKCRNSFLPLMAQGAPFVFLNSWSELPAFLDKISQDPKRIQQMQADVMAWYSAFMRKVARQFEHVMEMRFQDRMDKGKFTSTAFLEGVETLLEDPHYAKPLLYEHTTQQ